MATCYHFPGTGRLLNPRPPPLQRHDIGRDKKLTTRSAIELNFPTPTSLQVFQKAKAFVANLLQHAALMTPDPLTMIADKDPERFSLSFVASLAGRGLLKFFWPVLLLLAALVLLTTYGAWHAAGAAVGLLAVSLIVAGVAPIAALAAVYFGLRCWKRPTLQSTHYTRPQGHGDAISDGENLTKNTQQNHLAGQLRATLKLGLEHQRRPLISFKR